jgi:hypothetical protein
MQVVNRLTLLVRLHVSTNARNEKQNSSRIDKHRQTDCRSRTGAFAFVSLSHSYQTIDSTLTRFTSNMKSMSTLLHESHTMTSIEMHRTRNCRTVHGIDMHSSTIDEQRLALCYIRLGNVSEIYRCSSVIFFSRSNCRVIRDIH